MAGRASLSIHGSSHDVELVATSGDLNDQFHFDSQYRDGEIVFDYQIKEGSALTKNAVNTLESLHYPKENNKWC